MIRFERFAFAVPPCVAGRWFLLGCEFAGLSVGNKGALHVPPPENYQGLMLSIVRHPLSWLAAYYKHQTRIGYECPLGVPAYDALYEDWRDSHGRLLLFLDLYLDRHPGAVTRIFDAYRASTVMRYEDLPHCAVEFMHSINIKETRLFDRSHDTSSAGIMQERDIRGAVIAAEFDYAERYEYW
jgi:hypothetical protein